MLSVFVYRSNLLISEYETLLLHIHSMHMLHVGAQVIIWAEAHNHQLVTFVPYFSVENLATLVRGEVLILHTVKIHRHFSLGAKQRKIVECYRGYMRYCSTLVNNKHI
jgi:hypothetical protein